MCVECVLATEEIARCIAHQWRVDFRRSRELRPFHSVVRAVAEVRRASAVGDFIVGRHVIESARCAIKHGARVADCARFNFTLVCPQACVRKRRESILRNEVHRDEREVLHRSARKEEDFPIRAEARRATHAVVGFREEAVIRRTAMAVLEKSDACPIEIHDLTLQLFENALGHLRRTRREVVDAAVARGSWRKWSRHHCCSLGGNRGH